MATLIFVLVAVVFVMMSAKQLQPEQRGVVLRFGRFHRMLGPGLEFIQPFVEQARIIELERDVPGWRAMTEEQIRDAILVKVFGAGRGRN